MKIPTGPHDQESTDVEFRHWNSTHGDRVALVADAHTEAEGRSITEWINVKEGMAEYLVDGAPAFEYNGPHIRFRTNTGYGYIRPGQSVFASRTWHGVDASEHAQMFRAFHSSDPSVSTNVSGESR